MRFITITVFIIYLVVLAKLVIFKGPVFFEVVGGTEEYKNKTANSSYTGINLIPFKTIRQFANTHPSTSTSVKFFNLAGNVLLFIPFGFLLPLVFRRLDRLRFVFFASILLSLFFETYQLITRTGQFDIDDLILNSLGGVIGYMLLQLISRRYRLRTANA
jgi:glycopeptide antibiotics resistance protein